MCKIPVHLNQEKLRKKMTHDSFRQLVMRSTRDYSSGLVSEPFIPLLSQCLKWGYAPYPPLICSSSNFRHMPILLEWVLYRISWPSPHSINFSTPPPDICRRISPPTVSRHQEALSWQNYQSGRCCCILCLIQSGSGIAHACPG